MSLLRRLYGSLPILRELNALQLEVARIATRVSTIEASVVRAHQDTYLDGLLTRDRYQDARSLARSEHQVNSQNGEDGIIREIFRRIGTHSRRFIEIGVGDGTENNSAFLLTQGWSGCWLEGDPRCSRIIRERMATAIASGQLKAIQSFVTAENVLSLVTEAGFGPTTDVDMLSVDIDMNTYWLWAALRTLRPRLVMVEYNATLPPSAEWIVPYRSDAIWDGSSNFGASLKSFELLGRSMGYELVGCDLSGTNAFFVRADLVGSHFAGPFDAESVYEPPRYWLTRCAGHPRGILPSTSALSGR